MSKWKMETDTTTGKITIDEPVDDDEHCWNYYHTNSETKSNGYGSVSGTRELCMKHILVSYREDIEEKQKELAKAKKVYRKIEEELNIE